TDDTTPPVTDEARLLALYDTNNDGVIDEEELAAAIRTFVSDGVPNESDLQILIRMHVLG
ncbi:MAG: EF-hand domain-containing protein, partial [Chloroflexi bacterium]|nr:EF-hand domain-containing protein [Chloroflexota bacterium]